MNPINKKLSEHYSRINYTYSSESSYSLLDAYKIILRDSESNIGWRIIASIFLNVEELVSVLKRTTDSTPIVTLLPTYIIEQHKSILELLSRDSFNENSFNRLSENLNVDFNDVLEHFFPREAEEESEYNYSEPSIMLTSFEGCKGLSACHVFIVGLNKGIVPQYNEEGQISDIEVSKFIVAMTRTRKLLYLLSNRYEYHPRSGRNCKSPFISLIPKYLTISTEYLRTENIPEFLDQIFF